MSTFITASVFVFYLDKYIIIEFISPHLVDKNCVSKCSYQIVIPLQYLRDSGAQHLSEQLKLSFNGLQFYILFIFFSLQFLWDLKECPLFCFSYPFLSLLVLLEFIRF